MVSKIQELYTLWTVDLSGEAMGRLADLAPGRFALESVSEADLLRPEGYPLGRILIVCLSLEAWRRLLGHRDGRDFVARMPKIIILPADCTVEDMEDAAQFGFSAILREPLTRERMLTAITDTVESQLIFQDMVRMTKEIILDREIISRKNSHLSFLLDFLSRTSAQITPVKVMEAAWESLSEFLPLAGLGAVFWRSPSSTLAPITAHMFIPAGDDSESRSGWIELLLKAERDYAPFPTENYIHETLHPFHSSESCITPASPDAPRGQTIIIPFKNGDHNTGAIAMVFSEPCNLTRDKLEVLESAMGHLDLAMRNAFLFLFNRRHAELDTLTSAYNRRHFEETIDQEIIRHQRCHDNLALMVIDIDHFKDVNDTYGHQTGDKVLCELVNLLHSRLRSVDYLARYGGEEFVVILPHTGEADALRRPPVLQRRPETARNRQHRRSHLPGRFRLRRRRPIQRRRPGHVSGQAPRAQSDHQRRKPLQRSPATARLNVARLNIIYVKGALRGISLRAVQSYSFNVKML